MAQAGFTPIQLYRTTTASAQPSAGNLADGELAINLTDKKLYAKDASNNVFLLADAASGGPTAANLAGGAAGSLPYQTGANATTFLGIGTAAQVLQVNSGATAPEWVNTSGTGNVARTTSPSFTTPSLGAATALSINSLTLTTSTGTFTLANGKTLTVNNSLTLNGTDATVMTFPSTSATIARTDAAQTFTGTQTVQAAATQDAVALAGRAGGTSSYVSTLTPTTLSASRTVTLPDADTTVPVATQVLTFTGPTAGRTITLPDANFTVARSDAAQSFTGTQTFLSNPVLDAGTANGVLYLDGSKVVTSGSALTFDGTNLATTGTSSATKFIPTGGTATGNGMYLSAANTLGWSTNGTKQLELDASGNLGLGVTPSAWISTAKAIDIGANSAFFNASNNASVGNNVFLNASSQWIYKNTAAAALYQQVTGQHIFYTAPSGTAGNPISFTQAMTLDASGRFLVGTTTPVTQITFSGGDGITYQRSTDNTFSGVLDYLKSRGSAASPTAVQNGDDLFTLRVAPYHGSAYTYLTNTVVQVDGTFTSGQNPPTRIVWYTNVANGSSTERMRLDSSGNLGLGVTPTAQSNYAIFDLKGREAAQAAIISFFTSDNTKTGAIQSDTSYGLLVAAAGARPIAFFTDGTERARIDSSGNLGLGVTPSAWGTGESAIQTKFGTLVGNSGVNLGVNAYFNSGWKYIAATSASVYSQTGGEHKWYTSTDLTPTAGNPISFSQIMTLDASGRLGLGGTTSPSHFLDITGAASTGANNSATGADVRLRQIYTRSRANSAGISGDLFAGQLFHVSGGAAFEIYNADNFPLVFGTNATERARIPAAGGMVVGTAALATTATDGFLYVPTCAGTPTGTPTTQTGTAPIVVDTTNNKLYFYSGGQWRDAGP